MPCAPAAAFLPPGRSWHPETTPEPRKPVPAGNGGAGDKENEAWEGKGAFKGSGLAEVKCPWEVWEEKLTFHSPRAAPGGQRICLAPTN